MVLRPTDEQEQVLSRGTGGGHLVIKALAGTGKTSTLEMLSHRMTGRGLYLGFNRSIVQEAKQRFSGNVTCKTFHGLAYGALGHEYAGRLEGEENGQLSPFRIQSVLSLAPLGEVSPLARASLVRDTLSRFMQSDSDAVSETHIPHMNLAMLFPVGTPVHGSAISEITHDAATLWDMIWHPKSRLPVSHDAYLKAFCMTRPRLPFDYIEVDEGQDLSPMMIDLITRQPVQRIMVGDSHQQIYEWRGACSALDNVPNSATCYLTQSFRFGNNIAGLANIILGNLRAQKPVRGLDADRSALSGPTTLLFRSNMGLFGELMKRSLKDGQRCHIAGGAKDMVALLGGVADLKSGKATTHPDLVGFSSWSDFRRLADQDGAPREMQQLLRVATTYPQKALIHALRLGSRTPEKHADAILSTAHKAKGREFTDVRLGADFPLPSPELNNLAQPFEEEEARLAYVALTRAKRGVSGHDELVQAYRARLASLVKDQKETAKAKAQAGELAHRLSRMTPSHKRQALKDLSQTQKKALSDYLNQKD